MSDGRTLAGRRMISDDVASRRARRRVELMREAGMKPQDVNLTDPDTNKPPVTWERVEEILFQMHKDR
jgi:hypothetical protein